MDEDTGYGKCDEMGTGGDCDGCEGCDAHEKTEKHERTPRLTPDEDTKTQPVRIRITDLAELETLKENVDETPGGVIHRVLSEYIGFRRGDPSATYQYIEKLNTIIANQFEEIKALQREVGERDSFIGEQSAVIEDLRGGALLEDGYETEDDEPVTFERHGTTINIIIGK